LAKKCSPVWGATQLQDGEGRFGNLVRTDDSAKENCQETREFYGESGEVRGNPEKNSNRTFQLGKKGGKTRKGGGSSTSNGKGCKTKQTAGIEEKTKGKKESETGIERGEGCYVEDNKRKLEKIGTGSFLAK